MSTIWKTIGTPTLLNIPYFAMGVEGAKESSVDPIIDPIDILVETGSRAADWLIECRAKQGVGFYETREYLHPKTAVYQNWFVFRDQKTADEFFDLFPEFKLKKSEQND